MDENMLSNQRVLLVVGGGIAAYKAPLVVRALIAAGAEVRCVLTRSATEFVTPLALQAVSQHRVSIELVDAEAEADIGHIELARWPTVVLVAPATANLVARMAAGMANDLATAVLLATTAPVLLAPAMNTQMLLHPATQRNLETVRSWGHTVIPPDDGELACGEVGAGRQPDADVLVEAVAMRLTEPILAGRRVLVTAGPTRAYLDPVRYITNPSSGRMGVALARAAAWYGARVTLITGPGVRVTEPFPLHARVQVETAHDMADAVLSRLSDADWLYMVAAVGDFAAPEVLPHKRKKSAQDTSETWKLELVRTTDVLKAATTWRDTQHDSTLKIVGFAAETHDLEANARAKLQNKRCDVVLGNWVRSAHGDTFGADDVELLAVGHDWTDRFGPAAKFAVALHVVRALAERWRPGPGGADV